MDDGGKLLFELSKGGLVVDGAAESGGGELVAELLFALQEQGEKRPHQVTEAQRDPGAFAQAVHQAAELLLLARGEQAFHHAGQPFRLRPPRWGGLRSSSFGRASPDCWRAAADAPCGKRPVQAAYPARTFLPAGHQPACQAAWNRWG